MISEIQLQNITNVLCVSSYSTDTYNVDVYTLDTIATKTSLHPTRAGFLLYALLCGGDYDKVCLSISHV